MKITKENFHKVEGKKICRPWPVRLNVEDGSICVEVEE